MNFDFSPEESNRLDAIDGILKDMGDSAPFETRRQDPGATRNAVFSVIQKLQSLSCLDSFFSPKTASSAMQMRCAQKLAAFSPSLHLTIDMGIRLPLEIVQGFTTDGPCPVGRALLSGKGLVAVALRESTMNVVNDPLKTRAEWDGDAIRISGTKSWVVNAPIADVLLVVAAMDAGYGLMWVPANTAGLTIGEPLPALGYDGALFAHVTFDACRIPRSGWIGSFDARRVMERIQMAENVILIASAIGLMQAAFQEARNHAKSHRSGGKPVIAYQEVGFKLSEMLTQLQTAELLGMRTAWSIQNAEEGIESLVLCTKVFCSEAAESVAGAALQILSAAGFFDPSASARAYRCAKYTQIAGTSTEIARVKIGDEALGYR